MRSRSQDPICTMFHKALAGCMALTFILSISGKSKFNDYMARAFIGLWIVSTVLMWNQTDRVNITFPTASQAQTLRAFPQPQRSNNEDEADTDTIVTSLDITCGGDQLENRRKEEDDDDHSGPMALAVVLSFLQQGRCDHRKKRGDQKQPRHPGQGGAEYPEYTTQPHSITV